MNKNKINAIDLFAGCGGLSEGLRAAGFNVVAAVEADKTAAAAYRLNHKETILYEKDIRKLRTSTIESLLNNEPLHIVAGCPPCQGFSSIRKLNKKQAVRDKRNSLIGEYYRFIEKLQPLTIMLENVPGLVDYTLFKRVVTKFKKLGYFIDYKVVDVAKYGVPQRRKRLVLIGSTLGQIEVAEATNNIKTVRDAIGNMESVETTGDSLHKIYPKHSEKILNRISLIEKDGGSLRQLPQEYQLSCHKNDNVGFNDVYGRLSWDKVSSTITGGCLNPSKGRFLHPEENRCITAREAAILQSFPRGYNFPINIPKIKLALLIGNALPPRFSYIQSKNIAAHLNQFGYIS